VADDQSDRKPHAEHVYHQSDSYRGGFASKKTGVKTQGLYDEIHERVNRNAVSGEVMYSQYHKGKYLVAWHPKSSTENERHTVVYKTNGKELLVKQIAGAVARRIVNYLQPGQWVDQGAEMGFIKFGSRVDLLLPIDAEITVKLKEITKGGISLIAKW